MRVAARTGSAQAARTGSAQVVGERHEQEGMDGVAEAARGMAIGRANSLVAQDGTNVVFTLSVSKVECLFSFYVADETQKSTLPFFFPRSLEEMSK